MRLLLTTDTVGGVWTFTSELSRELLARGHAVHLVSFGRKPTPIQTELVADLSERHPDRFDYTTTDIPLEWMQDNEIAHRDGEALLQYIIQSAARPELILCSQFCFGALRASVPRIVVAHSDVLSWAEACRPAALEPTPWLNRYTSMVQRGLLGAAAVVTPTRWMLGALKTNFFLPNGGVVISNGCGERIVDVPTSKKLQAVTAGRIWDEAKGFDIVGDCTLPMPLIIAGDAQFGDSTAAPQAGDRVTSLGNLSQADLHRLFAESAIYLCTSRYEPFGLAPVEAALRGCAVVARDIPSLREVWADDALFFRDASELTTLLRNFCDNLLRLAEAQRRSKARAEHYTASQMTDAYIALFETVLTGSRTVAHVA